MTFADVIAELEKASEGSETLDKQIALVLGWTYHPENARRTINWWIDADENERLDFPAWTRSLDAALTLVPIDSGSLPSNKAAFLHHALWQRRMGDIPDEKLVLAICIAALKARSHQP